MMQTSSDYHRPFQAGGSKTDKIGRSLLDLLRSRDKLIASEAKHHKDADDAGDSSHQNASEIDHEIITNLNSLHASIRRCGLFATAERAQAFYTCASERSSSAAAAASTDRSAEDTASSSGGGLSKKRKRKNKGGTGGNNASSSGGSGLSAASYGIHLDSHSNNASFAGVSSAGSGGDGQKELLDEGLILTSICRILGVTVGRKKKKDAAGNDKISSSVAAAVASSCHSFGLTCAALNVLLAICTHAKDGMATTTTTCASIESEMIGSIGSPLLDALVDNILYFYYKNNDDDDCQGNDELKGLTGCFKSCAAVVSLLEMRLSRADRTLTSLKDATWLVLNSRIGLEGSCAKEDVHGVQRAAIVVLSTLPLVGDSEGTPPSKVWSQSVINGMTLLRWAIQEFFPMPSVDGKGRSSDNLKGEAREHPNLWKEHETWLSIAKEVPSESAGELDLGNDPTDDNRSKALQSRISCLTSYIHSLLQMEGYPLHRSNSLASKISLPLDGLVDVSEILLSFPLAAEAKHRTTKSRLRSSPVKDGLISPNAALEIAPSLRLCGHTLLDVTMESCRGGSGALSRARRLVGIVVANLQSSCSSALVSVVDGRRGVLGLRGDNIGSRSMGWLRDSIPLRIKSIQTFHSVIMSLGSGVMSSSGTSKSTSRALVLVGGSLLEQVTTAGDGVGVGDEWGTLGERAKLVEIASNALSSCLAAFGGLIPNNIRGTIDSIIETCLSKLYSCGGSSIFAYSFVKQSIIRLGMNCVCVSWGDGGRSNITEIVRTACSMLRNDSDLGVVSAALSTLCALDAFTTPRAPPILIPSRESVSVSATTTLMSFTASSLSQGIEESNTEMMLSKITANAKKSDDKKKKPNRKQKKDQGEAKAVSDPSEPDAVKTTPEEKKIANKDTGGSKSRKSKSIAKTEGSSDIVMDNTVAYENGGVDTAEEDVVDESMPTIKDEENSVKIDTTSSQDAMDTTSVAEEEEEEQDAKSSGNDSEEEENSSLDDFPDIVDEDPDEEDQ